MEKKATPNLSSSLTKLSASSRGIPSHKDFHFYYNFDEFKKPVQNISDNSQSMLRHIGRSELLGKDTVLPGDNEEACNWLENVNDHILERVDCSLDEFQKLRKGEEENGFQLVSGRKKKGGNQVVSKEGSESSGSSEVKVVSRDKKGMGMKPRVPFHIPTIPRPQDEYKILVNNLNQPFEHVWLPRSEDGTRFIHPLENFSALDFVDRKIIDIEPAKPPPIEISPYKLVEEVKDLKELVAKLRSVDEFAVDLEHNQYRSFQGLTCLMQISTRNEDFIVDTLKLRIHIGPYLREVFKDPTKKKVMHGADRDIIWLQRDFGIYICNLFDTGQASRVLKMERNSLEYLLHHFCGVAANKEYQNADWRLRPLTEEMLRYAREDTHYLLHIYDLMRIRLLCSSSDSEYSEASLVEVYQRSYDICMQLYEKEVMTDSTFLYIYGLQDANLNAHQLAIVAGLCEWRDVVARTEDESTGYILPNKTLLEIAKQMPVTTTSLHQLVKSKHPYVERHLSSIVSIIRHSIQNASAYEDIAEQLKEGRTEATSSGNLVVADGSEVLSPEVPGRSKARTGAEDKYTTNRNLFKHLPAPAQLKEKPLDHDKNNELNRNQPGGYSQSAGHNRDVKNDRDGCVPSPLRETYITSEQLTSGNLIFSHPVSGAEATVQVLKRPTRAFGTLLGNPAAKRKFDPGRKEKEEVKLEQIKSSVNLPFHSFAGRVDEVQPAVKETAKLLQPTVKETDKPLQYSCQEECDAVIVTESCLQDIIPLNSDSGEEPANDEPKSSDGKLEQNRSDMSTSGFEFDEGDETVSLADLSSSFKKCFQSTNQEGNGKQVWKSQESLQHFKPFDYDAARKHVRFGEDKGRKKGEVDEESWRSKRDAGSRNKNSSAGQGEGGEESGGFQLGRRRQAFPSTGNRSATFR